MDLLFFQCLYVIYPSNMIAFYNKLPLTAKLIMIGVIPVLLLVYFSAMIYRDKTRSLKLIGDYIEQVDQSAVVADLITSLGRERRLSYEYNIKGVAHKKIVLMREKTDSIIRVLEKSSDLALKHFTQYTFLDKLPEIRRSVDSAAHFPSSAIVQFYTDAIVRINSLNSLIPSNIYLTPVYQDLVAQRILSEMVTLLGIIRNNIYNALYTRKYMVETLLGTLGVYKVFKSYETEYLLKASPASVRLYHRQKKGTHYQAMLDYTDQLFTTFQFDSTYNAAQWQNVSSGGMTTLRKQQTDLWSTVEVKMKKIYEDEKNSKDNTLLFLVAAILLVIGFVSYSIMHITSLLNDLKRAARKISKGATGINLKNMPSGTVGNLAKSILQIDKNNLRLSAAAEQIGKGNFSVMVNPRSEEDLLGISINKMKENLREFTMLKDRIQKETEDLVYKRDEFFSIASHELKTPVTSLKAYTQLLLMDASGSGDTQNENMLTRMDIQINKLIALINDLLDTSKAQSGQLQYDQQPFGLAELVEETIEEIRPTASGHEFSFLPQSQAWVFADRNRVGQVINNFLTNAVKYAPRSREVIIRLSQQDGKVICSVQDFGYGINLEEQDKIFERFYRVSGNNLNTYPGLGLGLFICKQIIDKHGGRIWIQSEKDKGSTFFFELPVIEAP